MITAMAGNDMVPLAKYEELKMMYDQAQEAIVQRDKAIAKQEYTIIKRDNTIAKTQETIGGLIEYIKSGGDAKAIRGLSEESLRDMVGVAEKHIDKTGAAKRNRNVRGDGHDMVWHRMNMLDEWIQNNDYLHEWTGVEAIEFEYIVHLVKQDMEKNGEKLYYDLNSRSSDPGCRSKLEMRYVVFMALVKKRTNLPDAVLGIIFGMHRTTVTTQRKFMDGKLEKVLPTITNMKKQLQKIKSCNEFIKVTGGMLIHDGTVTPAPDSSDKESLETSGFSGKHHMSGFNTLLTCTANGLLVHMSRTVPGNWHDFRVLKENPVDLGLFHMLGEPKNKESAKAMAIIKNLLDKGFIGMDTYFPYIWSFVPHKQ